MPTDANGVYSLPAGYLATGGNTIQTSQHNPIFEDVASAITQRLMASGANPMTGPLKVVDGTVGAPGLAFNTAPSTGIYKTTAGFGVAVEGTKVAEFGSGGLLKGAKYIGEIFDYVGTSAPALCVFPVGQTLSRAAFPDLWSFAQTEIAAGNAFFNTGDGSTTFGIGDLRGRVTAAKDNMGGTAANRLTSSYFGASGNTIGNVGGLESHTLTTPQLASHSHSNSLNDPGHFHSFTSDIVGGSGVGSGGPFSLVNGNTGSKTTGMTITNASAGSGNAHNNVQPTLITNKAMFAGA